MGALNMKLIGVVIAVVLFMSSFALFTVDEREKAIMFRLGQIVSTDFKPGLHFKIPIFNNVKKFDSRILTMDAPPEEFLTSEKKNVTVDSFVKWRISDVEKYYVSMGGDERRASTRISQIIKDGLRNEFGIRTIQEAVSGERSQIMDSLLANAKKQVDEFGIEIVDVRIKRIDLPRNVSSSVYQRMEAERARVAKDFRSRGAEEAERIRADADRQREIIMAEAYRDAEQIRGEGDAQSAKIYAEAFKEDAEFYAFYRSLNAYKASFSSKNDVMVIRPDSEFFKYFGAAKATK
ncbi:MAG: protease modulator HflC [Gammaproteobacteria bacterium]|nr:protease modulator HflC [Gammaproteobacteria bacterium]